MFVPDLDVELPLMHLSVKRGRGGRMGKFLTSNAGEVECLEICYVCYYHFSVCPVKKKHR